jgi:YegS/Rv2252/BmrU family lipid kinase
VRRARLIMNPSSGRERGSEQLEAVAAALKRRFDVTTTVTGGDGDAERAAMAAAADGCDTLFIAGGDGTVNEAMNGLSAASALDRVTVGIIPFGTGNDFAAALGIPTETDEALEILLEGRELRVDLGHVNGRVFVNTSGGGFIGEVSVAVTPQLKTIAGRLAYLIGGAQALLEFDPVSADITIHPGGQRATRELYTFAVCNSRLIGGGRLIAPNAIIDDGLLDVCLIESMSALEFVALASKVAQGEHVSDPRVAYFQVSAIEIELAREVNVNTDGEVFSVRRCEYKVLPRVARFLAGEAPFAGNSPH